jgi:hypothetical protein
MAKGQLHKRFQTDHVKMILEKMERNEFSGTEACRYLGIGRTRLYQLIHEYNKNPQNFVLKYERTVNTRSISTEVESHIISELKVEKEKIIDNPDTPTNRYNYSYIKGLIKDKYQENVSLPTIISRAKSNGFWKSKPPKKIHDREVITNYVGEMIQHDSSHHLFAPDSGKKWYLITSLDDYSRALLFGEFFEYESSWRHIQAVESLTIKYGFPFSYYADQHSIFRYVKNRDTNSIWKTYTKFTDDVDPQWKQVLNDCNIQSIYALSPQAKGKIERPYQWLQDHLVRTCLREGITKIEDARVLLMKEINDYNYKRIHSTTKEIPMMRFNNAIKEGKSMFRPFHIRTPFESAKDLFCLRLKRVVDAYRNISLNGFVLKVPQVLPHETVEVRMYPNIESGITEIRFWHENKLQGIQRVKNTDIKIVHF